MPNTTQPAFEPAVVELRLYRTRPGQRDTLIDLFEREFVAEQERLGMVILAYGREPDDPDRFTWLRGFRDYPSRGFATDMFYTSATWQRQRDAANAALADSDDVYMMRPAWPGSGLRAVGESPSRRRLLDLAIAPIERFREQDAIAAMTSWSARKPGSAVYVTLPLPNNYPRLPIGDDAFVVVALCPADASRPGTVSYGLAETLAPYLTAPIEVRRLDTP